MMYTKKFSYGGLAYKLDVTNEGSLSFYVIGGETKKAAYTPSWHHDEVEFGMRDRNYFDNPMGVFRRVGEIVVEFVKTKKPHILYFTANNSRKHKIYEKFAERLIDLIGSDYTMYDDKGTFYFVKKET